MMSNAADNFPKLLGGGGWFSTTKASVRRAWRRHQSPPGLTVRPRLNEGIEKLEVSCETSPLERERRDPAGMLAITQVFADDCAIYGWTGACNGIPWRH